MILRAISPRLAIRIFLNICQDLLSRDVSVLSGRPSFSLGLQRVQIVDEHISSIAWVYHIIQVPSFCRYVRICEFLTVRLDQFLPLGGWIFGLGKLVAEDDVDRSLRTHYGDLCRWPGKVGVCSDVFAA